MKRKILNIGDKLYRAIKYNTVFEYTVIGVRERKNYRQYEVRCESCLDHEKCELLIAYDDYNRLIHIEMLNEDEDLCEKQRFWHTNDGYYFQTNKYQAEKDRAQTYLKEAEEAVKKNKDNLANAEKQLIKMKDLINIIEAKIEGNE